jgi:hypothetical protein
LKITLLLICHVTSIQSQSSEKNRFGFEDFDEYTTAKRLGIGSSTRSSFIGI